MRLTRSAQNDVRREKTNKQTNEAKKKIFGSKLLLATENEKENSPKCTHTHFNHGTWVPCVADEITNMNTESALRFKYVYCV